MKKKALGILLLVVGMCFAAQATSDSWNVDAAGNWTATGNWLGGNVPGLSGGTTSADVATFGFTLTTQRVVTVDANRNIGTITFSNAANAIASAATNTGYWLNGGNFLLSNGGVIESVATAAGTGSNTTTISTAIQIQGDGGSATIRNNSAVGGLVVGGAITGNSSLGNVTTLYLDGTNTQSSSTGGRNNSLAGISDGSNGGKLKLVKNGTGLWSLSFSQSTFSGGFDFNAGTIRYFGNSSGGFGTGAINIGTNVTFNHGNSTAISVITNALVVNGDFSLTGGANTKWSGAMDLGSATRTVTVSSGTNNIFSGVISGSGGLTKAGADELVLSGANTYSGDTTISAGTLILSNSLALQNSTLAYSAGANKFANGVTAFTLGGLSGSKDIALTNIGGTAVALTVGGNNSSTTYSGGLSQGGSLTKTGTGTLTLSGTNLYSGNTDIRSGMLSVSGTNSLAGWDTAGRYAVSNGAALAVGTAVTDANVTTILGTGNFAAGAKLGFDVASGTRTNTTVLGNTANGALGLVKIGAGTMLMTNANTYSGGTELNAGTLNVSHASALGTGTFTINGGTVAGNGTSATNNVIINGDFTASGNTGVTVASFVSNNVSLGTAAGTSRTITASAATAGTGQFSLNGVITNGTTANKIIKAGNGGITLGGANVFTGGVDLNAGSLYVNNNSALGTGMLSISNGTTLSTPGGTARTLSNQVLVKGDFNLGVTGKGVLTLAGPIDLNGGSRMISSVNTNIISGSIGNGVDLAIAGGGLVTLSGTNTHSGTTKVLGATVLSVSKDVNLGNGTDVVIGQNSYLQTTASFATDKNITMTNSGSAIAVVGTGNKLTLNGALLHGASTVQAVVNGSGMLVLNSQNNTFASTNYLLVNGGGSIGMGNSNALNGANLKFNAGRGIDNLSGAAMKANGLQGVSMTGGFTFDGTHDLDLSGAQARFVQTPDVIRTITVSNNTLTLSGILASGTDGAKGAGVDGGLTKAGLGTLILSGISDYTNVTTVSAGKLVVNGSMASKQVTVNSGGTLGGTGAFQTVTVDAGGTLSAGNSPGTMTFDGALTLSAGSTNIMEIVSGSIYDVLQGNGGNALTLNGLTILDFSNWTGGTVTNGMQFNLFQSWTSVNTNGSFTTVNEAALGLTGGQTLDLSQLATGGPITVIPEPATIGMLGLGALVTIMIRRVRRTH